jgi:Flp pilus assembly protein TadD
LGLVPQRSKGPDPNTPLAPDNPERKPRLAWDERRAGQPAAAVSVLESSADLATVDPGDGFMPVLAELQTGQPEKALETASELHRKLPDDPSPPHLRGIANQQLGRLDAAPQDFNQALAIKPDFLPSALALAKLEAQTAHPEAAAPYLQRILAKDQGNLEALMLEARIAAAAGKPAEAALTVQKALKLSPGNPEIVATAVDLAVGTKRYDEALGYVQSLRDKEPSRVEWLALEAQVRLAQGQSEQAAGLYHQAFDLRPGSTLLAQEISAWQQAGKPEQGLARLDDWLAKHPQDLAARLMAGQLAQQAGREEQAIGHYEQILALKPDIALALNNVAWLYMERGDPRALQLAERAHRLAPQDASTTDTLGWVLIRQGQTERGLDLLKEALKATPEDPTIRYHLAVGYRQIGRLELAHFYLAPVIQSNRPFPDAEQARKLYAAAATGKP